MLNALWPAPAPIEAPASESSSSNDYLESSIVPPVVNFSFLNGDFSSTESLFASILEDGLPPASGGKPLWLRPMVLVAPRFSFVSEAPPAVF